MSRPTSLTKAVHDALVEAVELGATWERAADAACIGVSTLRQWRAQGDAGEAPFAALVAALKKAEGQAIARSLRVIRDAAESGQWTAAAWLLERRYPADYGRRTEVAVSTTVKPVSEDETRAMLSAMTTAADQPEDG